jgi:hypothetical protein
VLLAAFPGEHVMPGSPVAELGRTAPRLHPGQPVLPQLHRAAQAWPSAIPKTLQSRITDVPGQSPRILRSLMYQLMDLPEPDTSTEVLPVPVPEPIAVGRALGVAR